MRKRMDRICDFGGSRPPVNPFTRIVAPGPAIWSSTCCSSSGSSGSSAISCGVSSVVNELPRTSSVLVRTTTCSFNPASGSFSVTWFGPFFSARGPSYVWNDSASAFNWYVPGARAVKVATPWSSTGTVWGVPASSTSVTVAMISAALV